MIPSNLHSCHSVIQSFRSHIPTDLSVPFADIIFPEEKLSCIVGREVKFLLAVEKAASAGCCIMASSTEPMRTEILFMHALQQEREVVKILLDNVLSFLRSRRAPDVEAKCVENMHSPAYREILNQSGFTETRKVRMLLRTKEMNETPRSTESKFRVKSTDSLLMWRTVLKATITGQSIDESRKHVYSETPVGTIQKDDLTRLIGYVGESPAGTIGYSTCTTIGYLDKLSVQTNLSDKTPLAERLLRDAIGRLERRKCQYTVIDIVRDDVIIDTLAEIGFHSVGQISYFSKTVTPRNQSP